MLKLFLLQNITLLLCLVFQVLSFSFLKKGRNRDLSFNKSLISKELSISSSKNELVNVKTLNEINLVPSRVDGCRKLHRIKSEPYFTYSQISDCLDMFQYSNARAKRTLDILRKVVPYYVFDQYIKNSDQLYPTKANKNWGLKQVNLMTELETIANTNFRTERAFYEQLTRLFRSTLDGHLTFKTTCYNGFNFLFPLTLQPVYDSKGNSKVVVTPNLKFGDKLFEKVYNLTEIKIESLYGAQVLEIEDEEVISFLKKLSLEQVGVTKDPNSRFNYLFATPNGSSKSRSYFLGEFAAPTTTPTRPNLKLKLKLGIKEKVVTLPYLAKGPRDFLDAPDYYIKYCLPTKAEKEGLNIDKLQGSSSNMEDPKLPDAVELNYNFRPTPVRVEIEDEDNTDLDTNSRPKTNLTEAKVDISNQWVTSYILNDKKTGVLVYPTNDASTYSELFNFQKSFHNSLVKLKDQKVERLILDLSYNTGGPICASLSLLDYLLGKDKAPKYTTDMKYSNLFAELAKRSAKSEPNYRVWGNLGWLDQYDQVVPNASWLVNYRKRTEFNETQLHSQLIIDRCPKSQLDSEKAPFQPKDITIISNGICLSSCATLLDGLAETGLVKVYYSDGLPSRTDAHILPAPHNMQGGQLYFYDKLLADLDRFDLLNHPQSPKYNFPLSTQFTFTLREMFLLKRSNYINLNHKIDQDLDANAIGITLTESYTPMEFTSRTTTNRLFFDEEDMNQSKDSREVDYFWSKIAKLT